MYLDAYDGGIFTAIYLVLQFSGILAAGHAVLSARTPQGSIAWGVALICLPLFSLPLYLIFGRNKFNGLVNLRRAGNARLSEIFDHVESHAEDYVVHLEQFGDARVLNELTHLPYINGNDTRLLIDGEATFDAIFSAINRAQNYVLAEFFIVKHDELGQQFKAALINAAKRGCKVYLLFDEVGSHDIGHAYVDQLRDSGVQVSGMKATQGFFNRFQLNFRNHRKIVVIDGHSALVGGLNVGNEYIHKSERLTPWRDTHMEVEGPAALAIQLAFVEDWLWATREVLKLNWNPKPAENGDKTILVLPSGPDDDYETCGLFFSHAINTAKSRLWIASPYFVPDEGIINALQLAAMRGVDVRILIPGLADKWYVKEAAMTYVPTVASAGVKMYEYGDGFLHQKVMLIDDAVSVIGTANLDNRSFRLNFEISIVTIDNSFNKEVAEMLTADFAKSKLIDLEELASRSLLFKVRSRLVRLFGPIL